MTENGSLCYGDFTFEETHPGNLAAIASLVGLNPPTVESSRVLEIGCGTGFNLLAMSQSLPGAQCTGLDYDPLHINRANEVSTAIGARNADFRCASIADFHAQPDSFDYIIAHGIYSWVPAAIRDCILDVIRQSLAPNGIAYISYNVFPGWHLRGPIGDALRQFPNPRQALDTLTANLISPDSLYARNFQAEWAETSKQPDYYILHEYLVPNSAPTYFHEFAAHTATHNLQFAAEANFFSNSFAQPDDVQSRLEAAGPGLLPREQYLDWLVGRFFRQSLLCHSSLAIETPHPESLLALNVVPDPGKCADVADDMFRAVLEQSPAPASQFDLLGMPQEFVAAVLWSGWREGLWSLRAGPPPPPAAISAKPVACPLARYQAAAGPTVTNRYHRRVQLTPEERELLQTLDGGAEAANHPALPRLAASNLLIA